MVEEIIALLSNRDTMSLNIGDIVKKLKVKDKELLKDTLSKMVSDGELDYSPKKGKYTLFSNSGLLKEKIFFDKYGNGVIKLSDREIKIPKKSLNGASYNDLVAISYDDRNNSGVVVRILERDDSIYVCNVKSKKDVYCIEDKRLGTFLVNYPGIMDGDVILVHHYNGNNEIISNNFSDEVNLELDSIPDSVLEDEIERELERGRVDYRDRVVFTIDGVDTKDIDDAVSITAMDNGNIELTVYIADVSYYINRNSKLYEEASRRGTSVYPPNSVIPMFPSKISNGICSLNPNVDRFAMAYTTIIDKEGNAIDFKVEEAIICSRKKMNYGDVNRFFDGDIVSGYENYSKDLYLLKKMAILVNKRLSENGYLDFMSDEVKLVFDGKGNVIDIDKRNMGDAEKIIEYAMVVTNEELSKYAYYVVIPWIYRNHDVPNQDRLLELLSIIRANNYLRGDYSKKKISKIELQDILNEIKSLDNGIIFNRLLILCQDKAKYSDVNIGHYALGLDFYSHNTSPIRRAPDLENQMYLKEFLHNGYVMEDNDISKKAEYYSRQERNAEYCEREYVNIYKCNYMKSHVNEEVVGIISYVTGYGFYVLMDNAIEGFVRIDELPQGRYRFDERKMALISKNHIYSIGDKILVRVKNVGDKNIELTTKDYDLEDVDNKGKIRTKKK